MRNLLLPVLAITFSLTLTQCVKDNPITEDAKKTAALKNVTLEYNNMAYEILVPEGALSGQPLDSLLALDSSKYANPANYGVTFIADLTADNTADNANDAEFDGMFLDMIMDTIESGPIRTVADGFEVKKDSIKPVQALGAINLETHRRTGLYIFRQTVDGNDLSTTLSPVLQYTIAFQAGEINLPDVHKDIPTRASEKTKAFLRDLLNSGILDEEQ